MLNWLRWFVYEDRSARTLDYLPVQKPALYDPEAVEEAKRKLGLKYVMHPSHKVKRIR